MSPDYRWPRWTADMLWTRAAGKDDEFRKTWFGARSRLGFRVELRSKNWIDHISNGKRRRLFAEPTVNRGWTLYRSAENRHGFDGLKPERVEEIFEEISRALRFLGYAVEWAD